MREVQLYGPDNKPVSTSELQEEQYTTSRYSNMGRTFGKLEDPDAVWKKANLGYWMLRNLTVDPHVEACLESRSAGLTALEYRVKPAEGGAKEKKAADLLKDVLTNINGEEDDQDFRSLVELLSEAALYGFQPVELMWETNSGEWRPTKYKDLPQEWFGWDSVNNQFKYYPLGDIEGEPVATGKVLLARHKPKRLEPMGKKLLTRCFWPVTFKKGGFRFWANLLERFGQPWIIANSSVSDIDDLLGKLEGMIQNAIAVLPENAKVEIVEAGNQKGANFKEFVGENNSEVSKVLLGGTLTMEVGNKGSYAASNTHNGVRKDIVMRMANISAATLNGLSRIVTTYNYGADVGSPKVEFFEEADRFKTLAENHKVFVDQGYRVSQKDLEEVSGFTLEKMEKDSGQGAVGSGQEKQKAGAINNSVLTTPLDPFLLNAVTVEDSLIEDIIYDIREIEAEEIDALVTGLVTRLNSNATFENYLSALLAESESTGDVEGFGSILRDGMIIARGIGQAVEDTSVANALLLNGPYTRLKYGNLQPKEAIDYLSSKGFTTSWSWKDVKAEEHAQAFTVAKAMKVDILQDIKGALDVAQRDGLTLQQFKKNLIPKLKDKGWWGRKDVEGPDGGLQEVQLGSSQRLNLIYQVNMQVSFQVGKWKRFEENRDTRPYLVYSAVRDRRTREAHLVLHGEIYHIDDVFWTTYYPPNDWFCRCTARSLSVSEFKALGGKLSIFKPNPDDIGPTEWRHNPGVNAVRAAKAEEMLADKKQKLLEGTQI